MEDEMNFHKEIWADDDGRYYVDVRLTPEFLESVNRYIHESKFAELEQREVELTHRCVWAEELNSSNWLEIKQLKQRVVDMKANIASGLSQLAKIHPSIAEHIVLALATEEK